MDPQESWKETGPQWANQSKSETGFQHYNDKCECIENTHLINAAYAGYIESRGRPAIQPHDCHTGWNQNIYLNFSFKVIDDKVLALDWNEWEYTFSHLNLLVCWHGSV